MKARYLIRLDDACPTMDHERWSMIETLLEKNGIHPIVAVVPDNQDAELQLNSPNPAFWDRVRSWKDKGWTIAMHGYQHRFHFVDRKKLLLPYFDRSEFGGLTLEEQSRKIRLGWQIFQREGLTPTVWIAPAHCFDRTTLQALQAETPIRIISDGIACDQFYDQGFYWVPQQLWGFEERTSGLWTICLHPNSMDNRQKSRLERLVAPAAVRSRIMALGDLALRRRRQGVGDRLYAFWFWRRSHVLELAGAIGRHWQSRRTKA